MVPNVCAQQPEPGCQRWWQTSGWLAYCPPPPPPQGRLVSLGPHTAQPALAVTQGPAGVAWPLPICGFVLRETPGAIESTATSAHQAGSGAQPAQSQQGRRWCVRRQFPQLACVWGLALWYPGEGHAFNTSIPYGGRLLPVPSGSLLVHLCGRDETSGGPGPALAVTAIREVGPAGERSLSASSPLLSVMLPFK